MASRQADEVPVGVADDGHPLSPGLIRGLIDHDAAPGCPPCACLIQLAHAETQRHREIARLAVPFVQEQLGAAPANRQSRRQKRSNGFESFPCEDSAGCGANLPC